jgi:hypothetical protein
MKTTRFNRLSLGTATLVLAFAAGCASAAPEYGTHVPVRSDDAESDDLGFEPGLDEQSAASDVPTTLMPESNATVCTSDNGCCDWSAQLDADIAATASDVAVGPDGSAVFVGNFTGSDGYIAKLNDAGEITWLHGIAGDGVATPLAVDVSDTGDIVVAGTFEGEVGIGNAALKAAELEDAFMIRLAGDGTVKWARSHGDVSGDDGSLESQEVQAFTAVTFIDGGDIAVAGHYHGSIALDEHGCGNGDDSDLLLARVNGDDGRVQWAHCRAIVGNQSVSDIDASYDTIAIVGSFTQALTLDTAAHDAIAGSEAYVATFNHDGALLWSQAWRGLGNNTATAIDMHDATNTVVVAGTLSNELHLEPASMSLSASGNNDMFIALIDADGALFEANRYGISGEQTPTGIAMLDDRIIVSGWFDGVADFGSGVLESTSRDAFVARFNLVLGPSSSQQYGSQGDQAITAMAASTDTTIVVGNNGGAIDLGSGNMNAPELGSAFFASLGL